MPLAAKLTTSAAEGLPRRRFTVAEVEAMVAAGVMQEDERVELIGGELVPMSPKGNQHEVLKAALLRRWYRAAPDEVDLVPETIFRLSEDTYLEPDVVIYPRTSGIIGLSADNVLLVVEIADSSLRYDSAARRRFTPASAFASFGSSTRFDWRRECSKNRRRTATTTRATLALPIASSRSSRRRRSRSSWMSWS
jgi:Putative restriction endonuclease